MIHEFGHILSDDWRRNNQGKPLGIDLRSVFDGFFRKSPHVIRNNQQSLIPVWLPFNQGNPNKNVALFGRLYNTASSIEFVAEAYTIWVLFITQNGNYYNMLQSSQPVQIPCGSGNLVLANIIVKQQEFWTRIFTEDIARGVSPVDNVCTQAN